METLTERIQIPSGRGLNDLVRVLTDLLSRVRVRSVRVDHRGEITYERVIYPGDPPDPPEDPPAGLVSAYDLLGNLPDKTDLGVARSVLEGLAKALTETDLRELVPLAVLLHPSDRVYPDKRRIRETLLGVPVIHEPRTVPGRAVLFAGIDMPDTTPYRSITMSNSVFFFAFEGSRDA